MDSFSCILFLRQLHLDLNMCLYQFYAKIATFFDQEKFGTAPLLYVDVETFGGNWLETDVKTSKMTSKSSYWFMHESRLTSPCKTIFPSPGRVHGNPGRVCKKRFSAIFISADKSFLAYPTGISRNTTGVRKCRLTRGGVRRLSCMTSGRRLWRFDVILHVLTSC